EAAAYRERAVRGGVRGTGREVAEAVRRRRAARRCVEQERAHPAVAEHRARKVLRPRRAEPLARAYRTGLRVLKDEVGRVIVRVLREPALRAAARLRDRAALAALVAVEAVVYREV